MKSLELKEIDKYFPSSKTWALVKARLSLKSGLIHAIVGENGAGKTTLMKILAGLEQPDSGSILVDGKAVSFKGPADSVRLGIGMVHQHFLTIPSLSAAENILFGSEPRNALGFLDRKAIQRLAADTACRYGFSLDVAKPAEALSMGERQQVEILRLLYKNCDLLILDEPTSVLTDQEAQALFAVLRQLRSSGRTIVIISHKIAAIKDSADRLSVLKDGSTIGEYDAKEISGQKLSDLIMGEISQRVENKSSPSRVSGKPVLELHEVSLHRPKRKSDKLQNIDFTLHKGEVLGVCGLANNGLSELEDLLAGRLKPQSGSIAYNGKPYPRLRKAPWHEDGIAYIPSDRIGRGSCANRSVAENIVALDRDNFFPHGIIDTKTARAKAEKAIQIMGVKAKPESKVFELSGGNIQKLILARELSDPPAPFCLLCEPGWGLDNSSLKRLYRRILELKRSGSAILLMSSDLDEICLLSDRIAVLHEGSMAGLLQNGPEITKSKLGALMMGLTPAAGTCT